jgi:hypothetical protein
MAVSAFGGGHIQRVQTNWARIAALAALVLFFATLLHAAAGATTYVVVDAIQDFETALYFSTVTFTSLGYADITLAENWRLLAAFEAANDCIMFGWTTALVVALVHSFFNRK